VECATEGQPEFTGRWTNMGHTWMSAVNVCKNRCTVGGQPPKVVVSLRDPYRFWRSLFTYAWYGAYSAIRIPAGVHDFAGFVLWARDHPEHSQSQSIRRACGRPCAHDFLLHTESLQNDWVRLLAALDMPLVGLPRINPTASHDRTARTAPPTVFTREVVDIIDNLEESLFTEFGYARRTDVPFTIP